jgi:hypothetical protein
LNDSKKQVHLRELINKLKEFQRIIDKALGQLDDSQLLQLKDALSAADGYIISLSEEVEKDHNKNDMKYFQRELILWLEKRGALSTLIKIIEKIHTESN